MLTLYYHPITCATAAHILLHASGLKFKASLIDLSNDQHRSNKAFMNINPKGSVPALVLPNGKVLTENHAVLTHIADSVPDKKLLPETGSWQRARAHEWMNYCASSIHPTVRAIFRPAAYVGDNEAAQSVVATEAKRKLQSIIAFTETRLSQTNHDTDWAIGDQFTACDAYLFIMYLWCHDPRVENNIPTPRWDQLARAVYALQSCKAALEVELSNRPGYKLPEQIA